MFMHSPCICTLFSIYLLYLNCFGTCLIVSLSLPLFLFTLVVSMVPKCKSAPSWNPFHFGPSSSYDLTPSHIRIHDEDARKDFSEKFSWRGVHSERGVILADFVDIDLSTVIHSRGCTTRKMPISDQEFLTDPKSPLKKSYLWWQNKVLANTW